jgi:S1-C subfamily serine protease
VSDQPTTSGGGQPDWRARLLGDRDRLGWWLVPLFIMVGLGGAVLAGSLAVVYYAQQVSQLESETRGAREDLIGAADEVREAADAAIEEIDERVASVREELARGLPLEDAMELGVVRLEVDAQLEGSARADDDQDVGPAAVDDEDDDQEDGDDEDEVDDTEADDGEEETQDTAPSPQRETVRLRRSGTGFVVVSDGEAVFLATSLGLLDDPRTQDRVPADVEVAVRLPGGSTTATVHSWDEANDLLLLRSQIRNVEPLAWRAEGEDLAPGDRVIAIGTTPDLEAVRVGAEVAGVSPRALVTSLPALRLVAGGPVVDLDGNVVGVSSASHGALGGDPVVVPIRRLCDDLLSACPD